MKLIEDRTDREEARRRVAEAEARVEAMHQGKVFHDHASKKVPLYGHTSNLASLALSKAATCYLFEDNARHAEKEAVCPVFHEDLLKHIDKTRRTYSSG